MKGPSTAQTAAPLTQNWVLDRFQDSLFIIAAPVIVLAVALGVFLRVPAEKAVAAMILAHIIFTVAHHVPTFIRIYGDVDLFRRFKWSFLLGPLIPFGFAMGVAGYINLHHYPIQNFYYLLIILALWDPWHFLMQHYGFMRIYDRPNAAPRALAARMDLTLCWLWFAYIMLASGGWLPSILKQLYEDARWPVMLAFPMGALQVLTVLALIASIAMTAVYGGYLFWCRSQGYFISWAKIALFLVTFGVMGLTYTPNAWILKIAPGWTFQVGFAVLGIVHVTQYMAIVWRYNRSLAKRPERARAGIFLKFHAKGGLVLAVIYVGVCLAYGDVITTRHSNPWIMSVLLSVGFTSTLMHYYFDGFIWKVRHKQNIEALVEEEAAKEGSVRTTLASWWAAGKRTASAQVILTRQILYFGVPMAALTAGAWMVWGRPAPNYLVHMKRADDFKSAGDRDGVIKEAQLALDDLERQLPIAQKMADLEPTASHEAEAGELTYMHSVAKEFSIPALKGERPSIATYARHLVQVEQAIADLEKALSLGGPLGYPGREKMTEDDARRSLDIWRRAARQCRSQVPALASYAAP